MHFLVSSHTSIATDENTVRRVFKKKKTLQGVGVYVHNVLGINNFRRIKTFGPI